MEKIIKKLEEEIKDLHYNPVIAKHSFSDADTKRFYSGFGIFTLSL
jgi:cell division protein FtsB